jgi:hypothetical protein
MKQDSIATSLARTLLALHQWPPAKNVRARPDFTALAAMDFLLRFPSALESAFELSRRKMPRDARPSQSERRALENSQLVAQFALWPTQHRFVVASLVGRGLARLEPAIAGDGLALTARGALSAQALTEFFEWERTHARARALARSLRVGAPAIAKLAARSARHTYGDA